MATYVASCLTKHSPNFWVLLLGRLLGGIATSLLFSAFESWAVAAHSAAGYEQRLLADLFTKAVFLGNGLMAIGSGLLGNLLVEGLGLGPVAPFDAAAAVLLAGGAAIHVSWTENYGDRGAGDLGGQFRHALTTIWNGACVGGEAWDRGCLCVVCSAGRLAVPLTCTVIHRAAAGAQTRVWRCSAPARRCLRRQCTRLCSCGRQRSARVARCCRMASYSQFS